MSRSKKEDRSSPRGWGGGGGGGGSVFLILIGLIFFVSLSQVLSIPNKTTRRITGACSRGIEGDTPAVPDCRTRHRWRGRGRRSSLGAAAPSCSPLCNWQNFQISEPPTHPRAAQSRQSSIVLRSVCQARLVGTISRATEEDAPEIGNKGKQRTGVAVRKIFPDRAFVRSRSSESCYERAVAPRLPSVSKLVLAEACISRRD